MARERFLGMALCLALGGCGDDDAGGTDGGGGVDAGGGGVDSGPPPADAGGGMGGGAHRGEIFFVEGFEDGDFAARGWYDEGAAALTTAEHQVGASAWECRFGMGDNVCPGRPGRHMIPEAE